MDSLQISRPRLITVCLVCRAKRKKCDKTRPQCGECARSGADCVYSTRERDLQTGRVFLGEEENPVGNGITAPQVFNSEMQDYQATTINDSTTYDETIPETVLLPSDHIAIQRGSRIRNISKTFWGFVNGQVSQSIRPQEDNSWVVLTVIQERLSNSVLFDEDKRPADMPPSHISSSSLAKVLHALPTKPVSNALFQAFLVSVYPIHPLVDIPAFQSEYDAFWEWAAIGSLLPPAKLIEDPTFTCLLFAILYSGASVTPTSTWQDSSSPLATIECGTTIVELNEACSGSLNACQHTAHPTINTLVASLLAHQFSSQETPLERTIFISTTIRLGQSMGLHRLSEVPGAGSSRNYRNRIWSHIMWLDVQSSIASGLPTCYHSITTPTKDRSMGNLVSLYAHGRYETARQQTMLLSKVQPDPTLESDDGYRINSLSIQVFLHNLREHISLLDRLIDQIPAPQAKQEDLINFWANASPQTHAFLYEDGRNDANVFSICVKIMLSLLKLESVITLQKLFLGPPESTSTHRFWSWYV